MLTLEVSKNGSVPIYEQIKKGVIQLIESGKLKPGSSIASENEMVERYGISRMTARKALDDLALMGIVMRVPGKGTFVAEPKKVLDVGRLHTFVEQAQHLGYTYGARTLRQELVEPSERVAAILKLAPGEKVLEMERLNFLGGSPTMLGTAWFSARLCAGLLERDLTDRPIYPVLEQELGLKLSWAREIIGCCNAPSSVASVLDISPGTAVITSERELFLADGTPIHYLTAHTRSDLFRFRFELRY